MAVKTPAKRRRPPKKFKGVKIEKKTLRRRPPRNPGAGSPDLAGKMARAAT
jgi:hypothetical protein